MNTFSHFVVCRKLPMYCSWHFNRISKSWKSKNSQKPPKTITIKHNFRFFLQQIFFLNSFEKFNSINFLNVWFSIKPYTYIKCECWFKMFIQINIYELLADFICCVVKSRTIVSLRDWKQSTTGIARRGRLLLF